jgi:F-type H+-transporting ATPase subunit b
MARRATTFSIPMPAIVAAAGLADRFQDILSQFGIESKYLLMQVISFSILAFVLYRFLLKPVLATMGERQRQIDAGLHYAEEMKAKLAQAQQESAAIARQAQLDGSKLIDEARRAAKELSDRQQKEAIDRANDLIVKAQQAIEIEHKRMMEEARTEVARLVVTTTQRVLARELSDAERSRYNTAAARELTEIKG